MYILDMQPYPQPPSHDFRVLDIPCELQSCKPGPLHGTFSWAAEPFALRSHYLSSHTQYVSSGLYLQQRKTMQAWMLLEDWRLRIWTNLLQQGELRFFLQRQIRM